MASTLYNNVWQESNAQLWSESIAKVESSGVCLRFFKLEQVQGYEYDAIIEEMWRERGLYIDSPMVDNAGSSQDRPRTLFGRWRVAKLRKSDPKEGKGIIEELHRGYLQAPGTLNDFPPTNSNVNNWTGIDREARIIKITSVDSTVTATVGLRTVRHVVYPNVATATVDAFCYALSNRANVTNPVFGVQTALAGTFSFSGVRNEDQGDGSSIVIAVLTDTTAIDAAQFIVTSDNCGMRESIEYLLGQETIPTVGSAIFPSGVSGIEYSMSFSYERETGEYNVTVTKREEKTITAGVVTDEITLGGTHESQSFTGVRSFNASANTGLDDTGASVPLWTPTSPGAGGVPYGTIISQRVIKKPNCTVDVHQEKKIASQVDLESAGATSGILTYNSDASAISHYVGRNLSLSAFQTLIDSYSVKFTKENRIQFSVNEDGTIDASILQRDDATQQAYGPADGSFSMDSFSHSFGKVYKLTATYSCTVQKGQGVASARVTYYGLSPQSKFSTFRELGRDWYYYLAVKSVSYITTDVTSAWKNGTSF